jgi:hypothetical protein
MPFSNYRVRLIVIRLFNLGVFMKQKLNLFIASFFAIAAFSSNSALASEPRLTSILPGFTDAADSNFSSFASGTILNFTLASENTAWAPLQTFSVLTSSGSSLIFAGSATDGATFSYTVGSSFTGFKFGTESGTFANDYSKVLFNATTGVYALAHEDWIDNDYNDMVITASVTAPTVAAVPEPEAYVLMLAGLIGIGFAARNKKQA